MIRCTIHSNASMRYTFRESDRVEYVDSNKVLIHRDQHSWPLLTSPRSATVHEWKERARASDMLPLSMSNRSIPNTPGLTVDVHASLDPGAWMWA